MRIFDSSKISDEHKQLLIEFNQRRRNFNKIISDSQMELFTCPSCGYPTIPKRRDDYICKLCRWHDDGQDDPDADQIWGGPNYAISLTESRLHIGVYLQNAGITSENSAKLSLDDTMQRLCSYKMDWHKKTQSH